MSGRAWLLALLLSLAVAAWAHDAADAPWENGLRCLVRPTTASHVVSIDLLIDYSAADEPTAYRGIRRVVLTSMLRGSLRLDGATIQRELTQHGGMLEGRLHPTMLEFTVTVPAESLALGMHALAEIVTRPEMADGGIQACIDDAQRAATAEPVGALDTATRLAQDHLFAGHPFYHVDAGGEHTLANLTTGLVRQAWRVYCVPNAAVMAVVGRCDAEQVRAAAKAEFGEWAGHARNNRPPIPLPELTESRLTLVEAPVNTSCVMLTFPVCGAEHPDYLPLRVLDALLSGGTGSRLFRVVREQRHLAYDVATVFPAQTACCPFSVYALTRGTALEETKTALIGELARLQTTPIAADDLQRAKAYCQSRYLLSHQYSAQYAFDLAWAALLGQGDDYDQTVPAAIDAITPATLQRVARTYFTHYHLIVVIPLAGATDQHEME